MTTSTEELRAKVRQLNFPTEEGGAFSPSPGSSLSGRAQRPRPSLGLGGVGEPFSMGSPLAMRQGRQTPDSLNLGVSRQRRTLSSPYYFSQVTGITKNIF